MSRAGIVLPVCSFRLHIAANATCLSQVGTFKALHEMAAVMRETRPLVLSFFTPAESAAHAVVLASGKSDPEDCNVTVRIAVEHFECTYIYCRQLWLRHAAFRRVV